MNKILENIGAQDFPQEQFPPVSILLVDDQPANLLAVETVLLELGKNLVKAQSGDEALRLVLREDFAVILLDVQMHGLDGFETAHLIRSRTKSQHTPIIFLTAYESNRLPIEQAYALGAVDYLVKPLIPVILRAKVAGFVELFEKTAQIKCQAERIRLMESREYERKLAEENQRLRQSEARQAAILTTALDAILTMDHEGKILEFNPAAERMFGLNRSDVLGLGMADLVVPLALRERHYRGLANYLATGTEAILGRRVQMPALRSDGSEFLAELAVVRIPTEGPPIFTAYIRDLTDRMRIDRHRNARMAVTQILAADAGSVSEAMSRILLAVCEALDWDVGAFWKVDSEATVLRCQAFWRLPHLRIEAFESATRQGTLSPGVGLPGRVWQNRTPAWIPDVSQDANFPRAAAASQAGLHGAFGCPILVGADFFGVLEFFCSELREPDADLLELMGIVGQISQFVERRRAEDVLRDSEQRFARFMQYLPGLAWIKDSRGRYIYVNDSAEKAFGKARAELYGRLDEEIFSSETACQFRENDQKALTSQTGIQVIESLEQEDGLIRRSLVSKFPILGPDGYVAFVGGMAVDISDRLEMEEVLEKAGRQKDEFLAMLAHELRNPLAPLRNASHILRFRTDPESVAPIRDIMERQVEHMGRLVDDLLDVSRLTRGKISLRTARLDFVQLVRVNIEDHRRDFETAGITVRLHTPDIPLWVLADGTRLTQVLDNLISNALKFTSQGGEVQVTVKEETDGEMVSLTVSDTGIGIEVEMLPRIFDVFAQADRSLDRNAGGLGLGLAMVKGLIDLHGGEVEAASQGLGRGAAFTIRLRHELEPAVLAKLSAGPAQPLHKGIRVLVIEDNRDAADSLRMLLELFGHQVTVAYSGTSGVEAAVKDVPDAILCDIGLPGMDGFAVAKALRAKPETAAVRLIAVTGYGQEEDKRRALQAGFNDHITKPADPDQLLERLGASA